MNKAIFLDRDGVIIKETGHYNYKLGHLDFVEGIVEALQYFQSKGYLLFIITNQGGIARRHYKSTDVSLIHKTILNFFKGNNVDIKSIYYCPHHDSTGLCLCRKPDSLMLEKAMAMYDIDVKNSLLIGDQDRDVQAGEKVGLKSIKIEANSDLTFVMKELVD